MKIMMVVYMAECERSPWGGENSVAYMGEENWSVGDTFNGEFIQGRVHIIQQNEDNSVSIFILPEDGSPLKLATWIAPHTVQRVYYGE